MRMGNMIFVILVLMVVMSFVPTVSAQSNQTEGFEFKNLVVPIIFKEKGMEELQELFGKVYMLLLFAFLAVVVLKALALAAIYTAEEERSIEDEMKMKKFVTKVITAVLVILAIPFIVNILLPG